MTKSSPAAAAGSGRPTLWRSRRRLRILGRTVAVGSISTLAVVAFATVLATTVGIVAVHALANSGTGSSSGGSSSSASAGATGGTSSPGSPVTTTTTAVPTSLAGGPDQSRAPAVPTPGGVQPGYGDFNAVACTSVSSCLAVGADDAGNGVASTSADGGSNWAAATLPSGSPPLDAISCADTDHCVAVGQGAIASTANGGSSWSLHPIPVAETTLIGASCPSASLCLASGVTNNPDGAYSGAIVRSSDGGGSWQAASVPAGTQGIGDVVCPTSSDCIAVGASLLVSHDGGSTWTATSVPGGTGDLRTVSCSSATQCIAIGANPAGLTDPSVGALAIETTDGGNTWTSVAMPAGTATLQQITCPSQTQCLVGGLSPTGTGTAPLYLSGDGGSTWAPAASAPGTMEAIAGLACAAVNHCTVVGRQRAGNAATASSSDLNTWTSTALSGYAVPSPTEAPS